ncbi:MAG TPA: glucoamylase family protein [Pseudolabrys sp.]|nr:glucoamylase family protein [Pseudolabrys sp.]
MPSRHPEPPIRDELFSVERLEQHAESLAAAQKTTTRPVRVQPLTRRLYDNTRVLIDTYRVIVNATYAHESITPAAEWLLDNFHVVDEQIREIKDDLPPGFYRKLPKLADGPLAGYPRVFGIAWALVAHTDSAFDLQKLNRFVVAYQRVQPLTIGELWALAITLRITLVENLRRLAETIAARLEISRLADTFADRILGAADRKPESSATVLQSLDQVKWSTTFAVQLAQRLRDRDPNATPALRWLNERLEAEGLTTDQVVRGEVQQQSAMNVTVRNVITSMRLVSMINWAEFFESVSPVDEVLRDGSDFAAMDFPTRDLYRRAIENIARESGLDEVDVARRALAAAKSAGGAKQTPRRESDPGYYLISKGRRTFERELHSRVPLKTRLFRLNSRVGVMSYVGMIAVVTAFVLGAALACVAYAGVSGWSLAALGFVGFIPASDVAVAMMNRLITQQIGATLLPGLELRKGVTPDLATIVVVPTLLSTAEEAEAQVEKLEVHHLANPDANFYFALLSDWKDSGEERSKDDDVSLDAAVAAMARLNERYETAAGGPRFFLLHRRRVWNDGEGKWIGWERKRGKLHELNRLLRGAADTTFMTLDGQAPTLPGEIRYVITLDADTRLPIGTARRLVGKIAHPLNRPRFDTGLGRVVDGHAILQPRVTPSLPIGREGSLFQRAFSGPNGLDPYALAISDVYQDLFGEGSYCGKGIYDVDVFESSLHGRIPENTVLSHDLLEGIFARAGLASDIEVVEEFPSRYSVSAARQHRWVRGDWQLLPWIFGFGRKTSDGFNAIPLMGRWKLLDNLRRSLSAPATLLAMLVAWLQPARTAEIWTAFILLTIALPPLLPAIAHLVPRRPGVSLRNHLTTLWNDVALGILQSAFLITFLAHQAWVMVDAVARTLFRVFVRRRRMLQWVTSAQVDDALQFDPRSLIVQIVASVAFAICVAILIDVVGQPTLPIAAPFAVLWVLSPLVARWASLPPVASGHLTIARDDELTLRLVARRTWRFFEKFVTAEGNMLPPDNFQQEPKPVVANRTSPTNLGLYLLSIVAARDFGWLGVQDMVERLESTFAAMGKLERFRGHFFNWYDTNDLRPLEPKYVSSVDSGNLAGHLIALDNACREIAAAPVVNPRWLSGLEDTLQLIRESLQAGTANIKLSGDIEAFAAAIQKTPSTPLGTAGLLAKLAEQADSICALARERGLSGNNAEEADADETVVWSEALSASVHAHQRDIDFLMPWAKLASASGDEELVAALDRMVTLNELADHCEAVRQLMGQRKNKSEGDERLADALEKSASAAKLLNHRLSTLGGLAGTMFQSMEFGFLFDGDRQLLSIGYRQGDGTLDPNFYDLLASEARLASFIAIAKGDLPAKHWFRLGRTLTPIDGGSALISWSGSMFEYLMPSLVMRAPSGSLLEQTNRLVVRRQEDYAEKLGVPWGISESEYNARDIEQTYQYSSFGVPDLGYKRGLSDNIVIAPYASGLASMIDPASVARNFRRLTEIGARGDYGWIEALDYTRNRLPEGAKVALIRAYMAHHQAMIIVAIANALHDGQMRERFHSEPIVKATELLLQERMPQDVAVARPPPELAKAAALVANLTPEILRRYTTAHSHAPRTHLLSNGRYSTMLTAVGSGYSRWHDVAVTRWREDPTCDGWGNYIFLRDIRSGDVWSTGYQPAGVEADSYEVSFHEDRAEFIRRDGAITTTMDVAVSPEDDAEVRRVSITNHGNRTREIDLTSYAEIALARQPDDVAHPAFSKLFVQTEFVPNLGAILATRRRRSAGDPQVWAAHLAVVEGETSGDVQFETDRARFLGRGQTIRSPAAIADGWPLSNTAGAVLDPIFSLRRRLRIPRGATARVAFWTLAAFSREDVLDLADKHHDAMAFERATTLAWTQAQMQLHHLGVSVDEAHLFQRLANHVLYSDPTLRPAADVLARDLRKSPTLWSQGISGDLPIVLVRIEEDDELDLVRQLLRAHEYWRLKQLAVDLVILNDRSPSYAQDLQGEIGAIVRTNQSMPKIASDSTRGAVFMLRTDLVPAEVRDLLAASARAVLYGRRGTLAEQINRARERVPANPPPAKRITPPALPATFLPRPPMEFFNGLGGFTDKGREYQTVLNGTENTPAPWINVVANPSFGFQVSNEGSGFTWSINSQQNQLTPWSNDPISDAPGEVIYVRDDVTGEVWGPTALPIRDKAASYSASHGQGYSRFEYASRGIALELMQYVPVDDSIKISRLKIINQSGRERRLSVTAYVEWVLGTSRSASAPFIVTEIEPQTGAMLARNPWNAEFSERVAFADLNGRQTAWTGDRTEFIGRDGGLERPLGLMAGTALSNRVGAALDSCGALQTQVRLGADSVTEIVFFLGECATRSDVQALIAKYRKADLDAVFDEAVRQWDDTLGAVQVKTPDRALDILLNRWLPYQVLACRVWARAAFYQASGAYGFRDQLQDVMALCVSRPDVARAHLLRAAARQFTEGDVQHWWLPQSERGIRTRIADDKGWLAYAVAHYVNVTGDVAVLDEPVTFLEGPVLRDDQHDAFFEASVSAKRASLFDHCALALDSSLATGAHGLPLMGTGDWNDGMDRVGEEGKGESVWLGWFLFAGLNAFAYLADQKGRTDDAARWRKSAGSLKEALEHEGWDGDWYRRAYFDDGTPLGSVSNSECRIDSIAQSWGVISGAAEPARAARAIAAVDKYLVRRDEKLVLLFAPPFDNPSHDPGYIKGYPAGIRENGGQYTHGAVWTALAFAMQGDGDRAGELLSMLNPVNHADSLTGVHRYKVEPYVVCADLYSMPPHVGRGGWTWYTGSAGWMYNVALEWLLGFRLRGTNLVLDPCIPRAWPKFEVSFRYRSARYDISVENPLGVSRGVIAVKLDGALLTGSQKASIPLADDGAQHNVQIVLGQS